MRILAYAFAILLAIAAPAAAERLVTDSAGRQVAVPDRIERVFAAGPPASVLVYAWRPRSSPAGRARRARPSATFLAAPYRDLPELGRLTGRGDTANLEVVLAAKPDLILDFGSDRRHLRLAGRPGPGADRHSLSADRRPLRQHRRRRCG